MKFFKFFFCANSKQKEMRPRYKATSIKLCRGYVNIILMIKDFDAFA